MQIAVRGERIEPRTAANQRSPPSTGSRPAPASTGERTDFDSRTIEEFSMRLLLIWVLNAIALLGVAYLMPAIHVADFMSAMIAALVLGLVNTLIRPLLILLTLPATLLTLGLFIFVVNGVLFWLVGSILQGFRVDGFWNAVFGAILYSAISWALASLLAPAKKQESKD
jgi:putative membrane protein